MTLDIGKWMNDDGADTYEVDGLGTVQVRPLKALEVDTLQKKGRAMAPTLRCDAETVTTLLMACETVADPDTGKPLFPDGPGSLLKVPIVRLQPLLDVVSQVNGFADTDDAEAVAGKLPRTQSA